MLDQALGAVSGFHAAAGSGVLVSVNLSGHQLLQPGIVELVADALARHAADPAALCLEVTESAAVADLSAARETLLRLRSLGVRTALDDFGTGYSSLSYLRRLPVDKLKIDKSFLDDVADGQGVAVLSGIAALASGLGLTTVAEGIETDQVARLVARAGCTWGQGYHFARPLAEPVVREHLARRAGRAVLRTPCGAARRRSPPASPGAPRGTRRPAGGELDPDDGLEVGAGVELPRHVQPLDVPPAAGEEPVHRDRVVGGQRRREPAADRRAGRVVVHDERGPAPAHDAVEFGQARFAAGAEEVGPPGVHHVDARVRQRQRTRFPLQHGDPGVPAVRARARCSRGGWGSTPVTERAVAANRGRWNPAPQPTSRTSCPAQSWTARIAASIRPPRSTARFSSS